MKPMSAPRRERLWQDEFSVQAADERYVNRRQFSKFLVLTSLGMFVGNLWILAKTWLYKESAYPEQLVAKADDIAIGGVKLFRYPTPQDPCILVRPDENTFVAYSQKCTHLSCAVYYSREHNRIECPCHEGYFSVRTGNVLGGPPPRPLPRVVLKQRGNELLAVGIEIKQEG
jgi:Rieske Fe-S protein